MLKGHDQKPGSWESVKDGEFYIINGQHSVAASKLMQSMDLDEDMISDFKDWKCFIVWTKDEETLRTISAYFNRVSHFNIFKPSWATNILGARQVWMTLGSPRPPKEATEIGKHVQSIRRNKEAFNNIEKYKVLSL